MIISCYFLVHWFNILYIFNVFISHVWDFHLTFYIDLKNIYISNHLSLSPSLWIDSWVNYKVGPYSLHHISIWFITFQLCQFGLQHFQCCVNLVLTVITWMEKANVSNETIKHYFLCHIIFQLYCHVVFL